MLPVPTLAKNTLKKLPKAIDAAPVFRYVHGMENNSTLALAPATPATPATPAKLFRLEMHLSFDEALLARIAMSQALEILKGDLAMAEKYCPENVLFWQKRIDSISVALEKFEASYLSRS